MPIFDERTGDNAGILVGNVFFDEMIDDRDFVQQEEAETYIINDAGYYLYHPEDSKKWGAANDLGTQENIYKDYPDLYNKVHTYDKGSLVVENNIFVYTTATVGDNHWHVIIKLPKDVVFDSINRTSVISFQIGLITFVILFFVFLYAVRNILKPLEELTEGAERIGRGDFSQQIKVEANDEIGRVAVAFNDMVFKLKNLYRSLESKVMMRTERLREEKNKISTILENIADGVFVVDLNRNVILFNYMASLISGYSKKDIIGKKYDHVLKFLDEDSKEERTDFIEEVFNTGDIQRVSQNTLLQKKDGSQIVVAESAAPLTNKIGETVGAIVVFRDISDERAIDKAKTEFVSLASHQLRTPLTAIRWDSELLQESTEDLLNEEQKELLDDISGSNERMISLVDSLLNVSRIDLGTFSIEPEECDLIEISKGVISDISKIIYDKKIKLVKKFEKDLEKINADKDLLSIIIQNLLTNAVEYSYIKGKVTLEIFKEKDDFIVRVSDEGIGIPENQKDKIFTKLFRADNVIEKDTDGNGLGLYIVKSILDEIGGQIFFTSVEGHGTTFTVRIPSTGMVEKIGSKGLTY